jgi:predicted Zn-dependent protease with MMP-like domain
MLRRARQKRYEIMVSRVVQSLSPQVQAMLARIAVVVEAEPASSHFTDSDVSPEHDLFGLYQGIPLIDRDSAYSLVIPDRITIFVGPLARGSETRQELDDQIRITILHELGHHLGLDEDGLESLGLM